MRFTYQETIIMEIIHYKDNCRFSLEEDGNVAYVSYRIENGGLDIRHTIVPSPMEGRGIASALVKAAYDYAAAESLKPVATCRYAVRWLERHPEYNGTVSPDYCGDGSCGL